MKYYENKKLKMQNVVASSQKKTKKQREFISIYKLNTRLMIFSSDEIDNPINLSLFFLLHVIELRNIITIQVIKYE